jgi:hypothetical protein
LKDFFFNGSFAEERISVKFFNSSSIALPSFLWGFIGCIVFLQQTLAIELRREPYLLAKHSHGITLRWRTDAEVRHRCVLWFGSDPSHLDQMAAASEWHHHYPGMRDWGVTLNELEPNTKYFYAIEVDYAVVIGADDAHWFQTDPAVNDSRLVRLWMLGDSGSNRPRWDISESPFGNGQLPSPILVRNGFNRFNRDRSLDGIILLGDNAYPLGTDRQYQAAFFNVYRDLLRNTPILPCVGNHDMDDAYPYVFRLNTTEADLGPQSRYPYYYSQDIGNVHIVVLDPWKLWLESTTDVNYPDWQKQLDWLKVDLNQNTQDWTILVNHFPVYCAGNYDSDTNEPLKLLREMLVPIIDQFGIDLVVAGHDHTYQRSYLIRQHIGSRETFDPHKHRLNSAQGRPNMIYKKHGSNSGAIYVISGTAGGSRTGNPFDHPAMVPFYNGDDHSRGIEVPGSFLLEIKDSILHGRQIDQTGRILDDFRLKKVD